MWKTNTELWFEIGARKSLGNPGHRCRNKHNVGMRTMNDIHGKAVVVTVENSGIENLFK
jgi:hypothetical protein